jgi:hypothetical protein
MEDPEFNLRKLPPPPRIESYGAPDVSAGAGERDGVPVYTMSTARAATAATAAQDDGGIGLMGVLIIGAVIYFATKGK